MSQPNPEFKILLLDSDRSSLIVLQEFLCGQGYTVAAFTEADHAVWALLAEPNAFSAVIADFSTPPRSGLHAIQELWKKNVPILLMSRKEDLMPSIPRPTKAGVSVFLKPFPPENLLPHLKKAPSGVRKNNRPPARRIRREAA